MCLTNNPEAVKIFLNEYQDKKIIAYKFLVLNKKNKIFSPYFPDFVNDIWKPGYVTSNATNPLSTQEEILNEGIHVFLKQDDALTESFLLRYSRKEIKPPPKCIVLKVICDIKDLLGVSTRSLFNLREQTPKDCTQALFYKVLVTEENLKEATKCA